MESIALEHDISVLDALLDKVYRDGGYDFRNYKRGTIIRRMARRLHVTDSGTYQEYAQFLSAHPEEYQRLVDDLTIKASSFFRSPYTFQQMDRLVISELLSYKQACGEKEIRVWSTACARGEEPYSLAILFSEFLGRRPDFDISIYATDISEPALEFAQAGKYPLKDVANLPGNILEGYFYRDEDYEVRADIRQMVEFFRFDLTSTERPPFREIDCVFCCNVLIYWQKPLQERVLSMLYDSLATPGYLVLGDVESLAGSISEKLECLDSKARIYKKVA